MVIAEESSGLKQGKDMGQHKVWFNIGKPSVSLKHSPCRGTMETKVGGRLWPYLEGV